MSNTTELIKELGLRGINSVNLAVVRVSEYLENKSEEEPKRLLGLLDPNFFDRWKPEHPVETDIMLKSVVEQIVNGTFVDSTTALAFGEEKIDRIRKAMPYVFVLAKPKLDEEGNEVQRRSKGEKNDKNARSVAFVKKIHTDGETDRGVITNKLAEELGTDYAGAYFYVKKAEKELGITLTAVRGRKAGAKKTVAE